MSRQLHEVVIFALVVHPDAVDAIAVKVATEHVRVRLDGEGNHERTSKTHGGGLVSYTEMGELASQHTPNHQFITSWHRQQHTYYRPSNAQNTRGTKLPQRAMQRYK